MDVTIQYFDSCANWRITEKRLQEVLGEDAPIEYVLVGSHEEAQRLGFRGSPTVLIDGEDPFAEPGAPVGFACRMYRTESGTDGSPSVAQLRDALGLAS